VFGGARATAGGFRDFCATARGFRDFYATKMPLSTSLALCFEIDEIDFKASKISDFDALRHKDVIDGQVVSLPLTTMLPRQARRALRTV